MYLLFSTLQSCWVIAVYNNRGFIFCTVSEIFLSPFLNLSFCFLLNFFWLIKSFGLWFYLHIWAMFSGEEQLAKYMNKRLTCFHDHSVWIPKWVLYQQLHMRSFPSVLMDTIDLLIHLPKFQPVWGIQIFCFISLLRTESLNFSSWR